MKHVYHMAGLLAAGVLCAGCYPQRVASRPGVSGMVLDAQTHAAVVGAQVVIADSRITDRRDLDTPTLESALTNARPPIVVTDRNGEFCIPEESLWVVNNPMPDWQAYGTLIIVHDGYQPALIPVSSATNSDQAMAMFLLTPEKK